MVFETTDFTSYAVHSVRSYPAEVDTTVPLVPSAVHTREVFPQPITTSAELDVHPTFQTVAIRY